MEHRPPKRRMLNDAEESALQKRAKTNPEEQEDGKIEYTIKRHSPSFLVDGAAPHPATKKDEISAQRPFGAEKTSMTFPEKIMRILSFPEFSHVIRWNLDGTEFCIFPDSFSEAVLEPHFQGTKFQSFTRKLNRFCFKRILDEDRYPKGTFAYHHDYFQRGREDLLPLIEIDSDKKQQRQISVPGPVCVVRNPPAWEESKDQYRSRSLDHFASQLSGIASSLPVAAARLPVASGYLPTQQEMNHLQALRLRQQQQHLPQREVRNTFNPLQQSSLPLYSQPPTSTAFLQDLSFRRQEQLARALQAGQQRQQVVPQQTTMDPRQQQIDPRLLYLLLSRQQQQQQQQQGRNPAAPP